MQYGTFACLVSIAVTLLCSVTPVLAQGDSPAAGAGAFARMVVIEPKPGQTAAFMEGYRRHLEWHREANDPWSWYGWTFVLGERLGLFMDGTFGHAPEDFGAAVNPAGDAADNGVNVTPYAEFLSHGIYERLDALSAGEPLPDTSAFLALTTYIIVPGRERAFEQLLQSVHARMRSRGDGRYTWLRLRMGGQTPQYLLMRPLETFGAAATLPDFFNQADEIHADARLARTVAQVRNELLRYQPGLSYHP